MNVLFADDDSTSRLIAQTALRSLGHDCHTVSDGTQAWDAFRSSRPDVVVSDWMMPGLTGLQLCRNIRSYAPSSYTYIIRGHEPRRSQRDPRGHARRRR